MPPQRTSPAGHAVVPAAPHLPQPPHAVPLSLYRAPSGHEGTEPAAARAPALQLHRTANPTPTHGVTATPTGTGWTHLMVTDRAKGVLGYGYVRDAEVTERYLRSLAVYFLGEAAVIVRALSSDTGTDG